MSTTPDPVRRGPRARAAILDAARELLQEQGFARLTIEGIAARAAVGKQTIYRWWPSKGAVVFDALLDESAGDDGPALPDTGDVEADLRGVLRAIAEELEDPARDRIQRALTAEIQHDPELAQELVTRLLRPQLDATAARLRAAQATGELDPEADAAVVCELLFGPLFYRWLLRTGPLDAAYADAVLAGVLAGVRRRD